MNCLLKGIGGDTVLMSCSRFGFTGRAGWRAGLVLDVYRGWSCNSVATFLAVAATLSDGNCYILLIPLSLLTASYCQYYPNPAPTVSNHLPGNGGKKCRTWYLLFAPPAQGKNHQLGSQPWKQNHRKDLILTSERTSLLGSLISPSQVCPKLAGLGFKLV